MTGPAGASEAPLADGVWRLRLYIAGRTPRAATAIENLKRICEKHLQNRCEIEVIDLAANPHLAVQCQIIAVPTLISDRSTPMRRIIGDLSDTKMVLDGLGLRGAA